MSRKLKNFITIILVMALIGSIYITMNYARNHMNTMNQNMSGATPPDMPNGEMGESPSQSENNSSSEMGESSSQNEDSTMSEPPEKPDGEDNNAPSESMPSTNPMGSENGQMNSQSSDVSYIYYVIFGIQNVILVSLLVYWVMSSFHKKSFVETLPNMDKKLIMILIVIICTVGLTYVDVFITKQLKSNHSNQEPNMMETSSSATYSAANEIKENTTLSSGDYTSTTADENVILVSGNIDATLSNISVDKTGDSSGGDNTSFYGINSAIIAKDGANLILKNITVTTNATGANGVFSYGGSATTNNSSSDGTNITISDSTITTTKDNSGGIMTTGGGTTTATNLTINTAGISSAAIRTDRGGGTVNVDGGTYKTTGAGSPTIYSTADVSVSNAKLVAESSEGIVIEGKNKVSIDNCNLIDSNTKLNGQSTTYKNIFLYQSMSGDAESGTSEFTAKNSNITTNKGDTLYVTNTTASIYLENNTIINNDSTGNFLRVQKDSWGNTGSNGGDVTLELNNQNVSGNIVIDSISTLNMKINSNSYYEGTINSDNSAKSIDLTLDKTSKIKLTGDSYITSLNNADSENSNIDFNGYKLYVNGSAIN
jgi:hypothetical protein